MQRNHSQNASERHLQRDVTSCWAIAILPVHPKQLLEGGRERDWLTHRGRERGRALLKVPIRFLSLETDASIWSIYAQLLSLYLLSVLPYRSFIIASSSSYQHPFLLLLLLLLLLPLLSKSTIFYIIYTDHCISTGFVFIFLFIIILWWVRSGLFLAHVDMYFHMTRLLILYSELLMISYFLSLLWHFIDLLLFGGIGKLFIKTFSPPDTL